jgi:hypothetical protein
MCSPARTCGTLDRMSRHVRNDILDPSLISGRLHHQMEATDDSNRRCTLWTCIIQCLLVMLCSALDGMSWRCKALGQGAVWQ